MESSREKLKAWLKAERGRTVALARSIGVTPQAVSAWARDNTPILEFRRKIAKQTRGAVPVGGWLSPAEARAAERRAPTDAPEAA